MKNLIFSFLIAVVLTFVFSSCKKSFTCECNGYSSQNIVFTEYKTVEAKNSKRANEECVKTGAIYEISSYSAQSVQFVNCNNLE